MQSLKYDKVRPILCATEQSDGYMLPNNRDPEYVFILTYDIKQGVYERYFRWVTNQFFPIMQSRNIYLQNLWHVISGTESHPQRRVEFVAEDLETIRRFLDSHDWQDLEERLQQFSENHEYRVVRYKSSFRI